MNPTRQLDLTQKEKRQYKNKLIASSTLNEQTGCLEFTGAKNKNGYGHIWYKGLMLLAHRISYAVFIGKDVKNLCVLHICDNPSCINPEHLFLGTHSDNRQDCTNKYRQACGEKIGNSKLTALQVKEIRKIYSTNPIITQKDLGKDFGVSNITISKIVYGEHWSTAI